MPPVVNGLIADPKIAGYVGDPPGMTPSGQAHAAETPPDNPSAPCRTPRGTAAWHSSNPTTRNPGHGASSISLRQIASLGGPPAKPSRTTMGEPGSGTGPCEEKLRRTHR